MPELQGPSGLTPRYPAQDSVASSQTDPEALARTLARAFEEGGRALAAYLKPREDGSVNDPLADQAFHAGLLKETHHEDTEGPGAVRSP